MINAIIILSGGMDSVTLLHYLIKRQKISPAIITFMYGQKHHKEIACAKEHARILDCQDHLIVDLTFLKPLFARSSLVSNQIQIPNMDDIKGNPQPSTYVPNRNMIFLSLAAAYAETLGVPDIYYGAQKHDAYGYWDTTTQFVTQLNALFGQNREIPIQIKAPFVDYSKTAILQLGQSLDVDYAKTWSCYKGDSLACGYCPTCYERLKAFADCDLRDPLPYNK
ncbi:MAG: queuosine biosynthesis protein QueC [Candidatus Magnetoglobus multicellularis str. Araruama]|uniref:7-cyano-7-deazaguanine synthase n=1 Tax=Candidatus Magnetoglobus multicellularis str. Araruama TaxID=890399 RepID=A0A1V1P5D2_9BACT|nr:MAG: queuosine biosynthesis protein QueC [Candidatus Magnetoglobus multicellularis str. Araruama]